MWRHLVQLNQSVNVPFLTILYPASLPLFFRVIFSLTGYQCCIISRYRAAPVLLEIIEIFVSDIYMWQ
jgi:hypothetical protein